MPTYNIDINKIKQALRINKLIKREREGLFWLIKYLKHN